MKSDKLKSQLGMLAFIDFGPIGASLSPTKSFELSCTQITKANFLIVEPFTPLVPTPGEKLTK